MELTTPLHHPADPPRAAEATVAPEPAHPAATRAAEPVKTVKNRL
ncbi:hypothetical protein [Streptomyces sp. NRRL S-337]|nr:hypothetical protein [Streptomyces sp. NRRL S-337]